MTPKTPSKNYLAKLEVVKTYIRSYWQENHMPPSVRDLARYMNASTSMAGFWLARLERDGWLEPRRPEVSRCIVPVAIFKDRPVFPGSQS